MALRTSERAKLVLRSPAGMPDTPRSWSRRIPPARSAPALSPSPAAYLGRPRTRLVDFRSLDMCGTGGIQQPQQVKGAEEGFPPAVDPDAEPRRPHPDDVPELPAARIL